MSEGAPAIQRREFGQEQPLTVALQKLVREYPLSIGLFKEFIQNADDAGASEIRFILDWRNHPTGNLPHRNSALLCGPSLLVWNNSTFKQTDIQNIQKLGDSQKAEVPSKIGRFGLGFNCCYNVTDHPLLLTGDSLFLFDPHKSADDYTGLTKPGCCWELRELWKNGSDLLIPFEAVGITRNAGDFEYTAFRLPLRTREIAPASKIRNEPCSPEIIRSLIESFASIAPSVLLFLKSVEKVTFEEIIPRKDTPARLLSVNTDNTSEVTASRNRVYSLLDGEFESVLSRITATDSRELYEAYEHKISVRNTGPEETFNWAVCSGLFRGVDDRLITQARTMWRREEKAIPLAGVAALISSSSTDYSKASGEVFCFLPLPDVRGAARLPVHINGFFDVNSSRRGLTHEAAAQGTVENLRSQWNHLLIAEGVARAYGHLLKFIVDKCSNIDTDTYYRLWVDPSEKMPEPLTTLSPAFYRTCVEEPLLRSVRGVWTTSQSLRQIDSSLWGPLASDRFERLPEPEIPHHILNGFSAIKKPIQKLAPAEIRDFYRMDQDPACDISALPWKGVANGDWLSALTRFAFSDLDKLEANEVQKAFKGLPFLLTADRKVHAFGLYPNTVLLATKQQRAIFAPFPEWFVDAEHARKSDLPEIKTLHVVKMTADRVVANLKKISSVESGARIEKWDRNGSIPPNENWLFEVFDYLNSQPESWSPNQEDLNECCLMPDQFNQLWTPGHVSTPLLPLQPPNRRLRNALNNFRVSIVEASSELLSQLETAEQRFSTLGLWGLTPADLLETLAHSIDDYSALVEKPSQSDCETILEFLASPEALESYGEESQDSLNKIKELPIFPTQGKELVSLTQHQCNLPGSIEVPPVRFEIKILKPGRWDGLLERLGIDELSLVNLIEKILLPNYSNISESDQSLVLSWIRDHFDEALTAADTRKAEFIDKLTSAPLVRCEDHVLCSGRNLYDPREPVIREVLGGRAHFPSLKILDSESDRWLLFFERLGMTRKIRAQDLVDYIQVKMDEARTNFTPETERHLERLLKHLIEHWPDLKDVQIVERDGAPHSFRSFLTRHAWCPALRDHGKLKQFVVFNEPEPRLFRLRELFPRSKGHLVASVCPLLPGGHSDTVPNLIRDLVPDNAAVSIELVASHFENVLNQYSSVNLSDQQVKELVPPLQHIYSYLGLFLHTETDPEHPALLRQIQERFRGQPCIFVDDLKAFRKPHRVFRSAVSYAKGWFFHARYTTDAVDAGLTTLGRRDEPDLDDLCKLTLELSESVHQPLDEELTKRFLRLLNHAGSVLSSHGNPPPELRVLDAQQHIVPPRGLFLLDCDWLPEFPPGLIPLAHSDLSETLVNRACIKRLSEYVKCRLKGELLPSTSPAFLLKCEKIKHLLQSHQLEIGLRRILAKLKTSIPEDGLNWLKHISLNPVQSILCDYFVQIDNNEIVIGEKTTDLHSGFDPATGIQMYVAESAQIVLENLIAGELQKQFVSHQLAQLTDLSPVTAILQHEERDIQKILDQLRYPRLPHEPETDALDEGEGLGASDLFKDPAKGATSGESDPADSDLGGPNRENKAPSETGDTGEKESKERDSSQPEKSSDTKHGESLSQERSENEQDPETTYGDHDGSDDESSESPWDNEDEDEVEDEEEDDGKEYSSAGRGHGSSGGKRSSDSRSRGHRSRDHHQRRGGGSGQTRSGKTHGTRSASPSRGRVTSYVLTQQQTEEAKARHDPANDELSEHKQLGDDAVGWVLQYERQHGRNPEPQAHNNPGFDVLSRAPLRVRFIEVKGIRGGWGADSDEVGQSFRFISDRCSDFIRTPVGAERRSA